MAQFPSQNINPSKKANDPKFLREMGKAIWDEFRNISKKSFVQGGDRYALNKLYSLGKQPNERYRPMFEIAEDEDSSFINLDMSPPAIIPKFKRIVNNKFSKIDFTIEAQAIDPFALEDKKKYEDEERANIQTRNMLDELGIQSHVLNTGELDQPMDDEEMAIKMQFGYKHNMAIDIEKRIDAVFQEERISDKLVSVRDYLWDTGAAALKVFTDKDTGKVGFRAVDTSNFVISPSKDPFFRDAWYAGEAILMSIDEIRRSSDLTEDQLAEVAQRLVSKYGNPTNITTGANHNYDSFKVPVFDFEVKSLDSYKYEKRIDKRGNPVFGKTATVNEGRENYEDKKYNVYRAKWIIETDHLFNYGLKSDVVRKPSCMWNAKLSFIVAAPEINQMETSPIVENLIPIVDQIVIAWYKLQNVIARARPKGIMIEIGALEDISLGDGGEGPMKPIEILDMFTQTGSLVFRRINMEGAPLNYRPIEELTNGLGTEAQEHFAVIENYMSMIRSMIGFNDLTDGSTPDPKTLNKVAAIAVENTNNAIHHLLYAERYLVEMLADDVAVRVHDSITLKKNSVYRKVLGPQTIKSIKEDKNHIHREYGVFVNYNADPTDRRNFEEVDLNSAVQNGQITVADKIAIKHIRNLKQAELVLAHRIKKNQERQAELERQKIVEASQSSAEAARVAEEEKRKTLQVENELEKDKQSHEYALKEKLLKLEYDLKERNESSNNETKKDVKRIESEGTKEVAKIKKSDTSPKFA